MFRRLLISLMLFLFLAAKTMAGSDTGIENFVAIADIHFDPFITCTTVPCPLITKLRQAPAEKWESIFLTYDNGLPGYRQDTNYTLLVSALTAASKTAEEKKAKFVVVLGDLLGHDLDRTYRKYTKDKSDANYRNFIQKTMIFLSLMFAKYFPNVDVYPVIGNNDSSGGDYVHEGNGKFLASFANLWSPIIKNSQSRQAMLATFKAHGFYAITVPGQPHTKLLILNSVLFSNHARGKNLKMAAEEQLSWLQQQLRQAKANNDKVMLFMHIPPGIDVYATLRLKLFTLVELWHPKYTKRFKSLLDEYNSQISAMLAGHLHADWFQILTFPNDHEIPNSGVPAVSPIFGNNPGFKVYEYKSNDLQLENFISYYYPIKRARIWQREYDFKQAYLPDCKTCSLIAAMKTLTKDNALSKLYQRFYAVSTDSQPISNHFSPFYWCAVHSIEAHHYRNCIG